MSRTTLTNWPIEVAGGTESYAALACGLCNMALLEDLGFLGGGTNGPDSSTTFNGLLDILAAHQLVCPRAGLDGTRIR